jgi:hypothetical protein
MLGGDLHRLIEIRALKKVIAGDQFLGFCKRG